MTDEDTNQQQSSPVTAVQDLIAGGVAGSASVIVGHPFDTYKVRLQTASTSSPTSNVASFGGISSLFRGMAPPLSTAAVVNSLIFSSYGECSRVWDNYFTRTESDGCNRNDNGNGSNGSDNSVESQSSWKKAFICGCFAGFVQSLVICPSDHVKCRLQIQHGIGSKDYLFKGPIDAMDKILSSHGIKGLYRGFICTAWREVPAFGLYFATYDFVKEEVKTLITTKEIDKKNSSQEWSISALAGGCSGALTWFVIYPFDVIKTKIQTAPLDTPIEKRRILHVYNAMRKKHGIQFFFRGLSVTLLRAFPVNAIIFPVYEFTLSELTRKGIGALKTSDYMESAA